MMAAKEKAYAQRKSVARERKGEGRMEVEDEERLRER